MYIHDHQASTVFLKVFFDTSVCPVSESVYMLKITPTYIISGHFNANTLKLFLDRNTKTEKRNKELKCVAFSGI